VDNNSREIFRSDEFRSNKTSGRASEDWHQFINHAAENGMDNLDVSHLKKMALIAREVLDNQNL